MLILLVKTVQQNNMQDPEFAFSTQSCRPSFLSAYISVDSQHVVPASLRRHVGISVHIGHSRRIDATSQLRLRLLTSITFAYFWLLLQSRYSRCRNQGGFRRRFTRSLIFLVCNIVSYADVGFFKGIDAQPLLTNFGTIRPRKSGVLISPKYCRKCK